MSEATIPLVDSKSLLTLFGTRDQHLRKIRESLGVSVSGRDDRIHIEGQDEAVAQATEVFEQLKELADRYGTVSPEEVSQVLSQVTGKSLDVEHAPIELQSAGRPIRPAHRGPGPLRDGHRRKRPGVLQRPGGHGQDLPGRGHGRASI